MSFYSHNNHTVMQGKHIFILFLLCLPLLVSAQKKEISAARDMVKANKTLPKAEEMMRKLLNDCAMKRYGLCFLMLSENNMKRVMSSSI